MSDQPKTLEERMREITNVSGQGPNEIFWIFPPNAVDVAKKYANERTELLHAALVRLVDDTSRCTRPHQPHECSLCAARRVLAALEDGR